MFSPYPQAFQIPELKNSVNTYSGGKQFSHLLFLSKSDVFTHQGLHTQSMIITKRHYQDKSVKKVSSINAINTLDLIMTFS